jgi:hypothetical protein
MKPQKYTHALEPNSASRAPLLPEQAFRILLKFPGNVPVAALFNPRSIEEERNEEVWICVGRAWRDRYRGAVYC